MPKHSEIEAKIRQAVLLIERRLNDPSLRPSTLARLVGLDIFRFSREFKRIVGKTCSEYIISRRIEQAKKLLSRNDLLVKEVADRVGFDDPNYFTRCFTRLVGRAPSEFRNSRTKSHSTRK